MFLIVGLGNPGQQYAHTRHNVGFDVLDALAEKTDISITKEKEGALVGEGFVNGQKIVLVKPQTFMNLSGEAVMPLAHWYKVEPDHLMVVYDDTDLAQGAIRIRKNGSAGTHNGMRSIVGLLGYENFPRLRVGIGQRREGYELADWVLGHYIYPEEKETAEQSFRAAADAILCYITDGIDMAMNRFNTKKEKPSKVKEDTASAPVDDEGKTK